MGVAGTEMENTQKARLTRGAADPGPPLEAVSAWEDGTVSVPWVRAAADDLQAGDSLVSCGGMWLAKT